MTLPALHTLERQYYTSDSIYQAELERIFYKSWICVGRAEQIPNPGDYFVRSIGDENLIITRDRQGEIHAFYNVCRHRGTRLCEESSGHFRESIQCPYHAWTYGLDGRLIGVPGMAEMTRFDKSDYGLYQPCLDSWLGFLFVNLDSQAEPLAQAMASLDGKFDRWNVSNLRSAHRIDYDTQANWKILTENYSECYHCPLVHPALSKLSPYDSGKDDLTAGPFLGGHMKINEDSLTLNGGTSRPPLGQVAGDDLHRVYYYSLFPNMLLSLHPDYVMYHTLWPQGAGRTLITCEWLFDPEVMAQPGFDPSDAVEFWDMTNRQDWHICEESQIGVRSRVYTPGPANDWHEAMPLAFDAQVLKTLGRLP